MGHLNYDAIIIGTGQGGKPLAGALAEAGWKIAVVERDRVGGTCVVVGCTPTKTMVASARVAHLAARGADYGVTTGRVDVDLGVVRKRKRDIVDMFSGGSQRGLEKHETLDLIFGEASFVAPDRVRVIPNDGSDDLELVSDKIFINAGARPTKPNITGLDGVHYLDSTSIMELGATPDHLIVVGAGFVGLEFGQMFRRFGSAVTIVDMRSRLLHREDEEFGDALAPILVEEGVDLRLGTTCIEVAPAGGGVGITIDNPAGNGTITGSHLLVAAGRTPNTDRLNVEAAGLMVDERGYIAANERLETNVPGIWALGDINGGPAFTQISYDDYRVITENVLRDGNATTAGRFVPSVMFTDPQYGRVGLSEREARESGLNVKVVSMPMTHVARALEMDETRGLMKAIVDADTGLIVGAAVLAVEGGELMSMIQIAMMGGLDYKALHNGVFAHPTLAESLNNLFAKAR